MIWYGELTLKVRLKIPPPPTLQTRINQIGKPNWSIKCTLIFVD